MLYRIKDFEQVYNISENKFKSRGEDNIDIKKSIETVVEVAQNDLQKKGIDLTFNYTDQIP